MRRQAQVRYLQSRATRKGVRQKDSLFRDRHATLSAALEAKGSWRKPKAVLANAQGARQDRTDVNRYNAFSQRARYQQDS